MAVSRRSNEVSGVVVTRGKGFHNDSLLIERHYFFTFLVGVYNTY